MAAVPSRLPDAVLARIARCLLPPEPPLPPLHPPASAAAAAGGGDAAAAHHAALCAAAWAPLAAMRATCKEWCAASTQELRCPPDWLPPAKALAPPGRWRGAPLTSLCIAVPLDVLDQQADLDVWQAGVRQQLQQLYPSLRDVRWQLLDLLEALNRRLSWVVGSDHASWIGGGRGRERMLGLLPQLVAGSVVSEAPDITVAAPCMWWGAARLNGPLTVRQLVRDVAGWGMSLAPGVYDPQFPEERPVRLWDTVGDCRFFEGIRGGGSTFFLTLGS